MNDHLRKKYEIGGHYANHCGGVNVPVCKTWIEGVERDKTREQTMWGIKTFGEYLIKELITGRNPMTEIIYLTMITTTLLMISFYTGRVLGRKDVCNAIEVAIEKIGND